MELDSIEAIKAALTDNNSTTVFNRAEKFFRQAAQENREDVKVLLKELVVQHETMSDAIGWLGEYRDSELIPFFVSLLDNDKTKGHALTALLILAGAKVLQSDDSRAMGAILKIVSEDDDTFAVELAIQVLINLRATGTLDLIMRFLDHPNYYLRETAMQSTILFGKLAGRDEVIEKVLPLLQDPSPHVRLTTAMVLHDNYPQHFPEDPVKRLMEISSGDSEEEQTFVEGL